MFLIVLLVLVGSNVTQGLGLLATYFLGDQLPNTDLFRIVFWGLWLPVAILVAWCGLAGGYLALRKDTFDLGYLTAFGLLLCPVLKVDHRDLGWAAYSLSLYLGLTRFAVGCNFVGVAFLVWLYKLRDLENPWAGSSNGPLSPVTPVNSPQPPASPQPSHAPHYVPRVVVLGAIISVALWVGLGGYDKLTAPNPRWKLPSGDSVEILTHNNEYSAGYEFKGRIVADHYLLIQFRSSWQDPARDRRDVLGIMDLVCVWADSMEYRRINIQPTKASFFGFIKYGLNNWATVDSGGRCHLDRDR